MTSLRLGTFFGLLHGTASWGATANPEAEIAALKRQDDAVLRVGERLVLAGTRFCSRPGWSAGMTVQRLSQYGKSYRSAAVKLLGVTDLPTVTGVVEGGAAASAGLRPRDVITEINGQPFTALPPNQPKGDFAATAVALDTIEQALAHGDTTIGIRRDNLSLKLRLIARPACRARFDIRAGNSKNASSDGINVQVSSNLADEVQNDAELATVLAHELAHNILRHPQRLVGARPRPTVRDTEIEADRLSVYLLDAAGYPVSAASAFWTRWGRANDAGIFADNSHPNWKQRIRAIESEAIRIAAQRGAGQSIHAPADLSPR